MSRHDYCAAEHDAKLVYRFDDQDSRVAAGSMQGKQLRRLVVLDRDKKLLGIVSLGDLVIETGNDRLTGQVLGRVSEPVHPRDQESHSMFSRILVALDGSTAAEEILPHVEPLADTLGATVILLRAIPALERAVAAQAGIAAGFVGATPVIEQERSEATHYLERVGERLINRGLDVVWKQPEGPASESILEHAQASNADLIALTTHGRGGLGRSVFGSVADEVLRRARCPLLLLRVNEESRP